MEFKNSREYHDLHVESYTFSSADIFENFRNIDLKIEELGLANFLSIPELRWYKPWKTKIRSFNSYRYLLLVEKGIWGRIFHSICQYAKANHKYMKHYDKNKELWYTGM